MPAKAQFYAPDAIDVQNQLSAIGKDWGLFVRFTVTVEHDTVVCVARAYDPAQSDENAVVLQALIRKPVRSKPDITQMCFSAAVDIWHQADRGVLGAKPPAVAHEWNGRPAIARRR